MVRSLFCLCLVGLVLGAFGRPAAGDAKANRKTLAKVKGKAYFTNMVLDDRSLGALAARFADKEASVALTRASDNTWSATLVAFFGKRPARGPLTLWFRDKDKPGQALVTKSIDRKARTHLIYDMLLDGDRGFKMCRTYVVQVGQILRGKHKVYAAGEVLTDPKSPKCARGKGGKKNSTAK